MKFILSRSLIVKLFSNSILPFNRPFHPSNLRYSAAGDEAYWPRNGKRRSFSSSSSKDDDDNRKVKIAVWWDIENCNIPKGVDAYLVGNHITSAIRSSGIKGPITINAFGDVDHLLSNATQKAITSTGIRVTNVPRCQKNSADKSIMDDMNRWVSQNPPPAHIFLISDDSDFSKFLHRLRRRNYNILISCTGTASGDLRSAATVMLPWIGLVKGENVAAKHYKYPPDGLYGSWYCHCEVVLDDPFEDADNPTTSQPEESNEQISEPKIRRIPKAVVKGIQQVLHSYPNGISLPLLRIELKRNNIIIDKDFYGHKNFPQFLEALNLLKATIPPPAGGGKTPVGGEQQLDPLKNGEHS